VEGEVLFGGRRIDEIGLTPFRRLVGTVMQDDTVFGGTIAENISFFAADVDIARIEACAALAGLHAEIDRKPMGYDSLVGAGGCLLSGGQKQRLLLARALYKQPRLLLLDEATSHLDTANETAINAAVRAMQLTRIVIAHRPQTIASAERVFRLEHGRVDLFDDYEAHRGQDAGAVGTHHAHRETA
jgi:ATP-binding cassette subfamily B protein RaxB